MLKLKLELAWRGHAQHRKGICIPIQDSHNPIPFYIRIRIHVNVFEPMQPYGQG